MQAVQMATLPQFLTLQWLMMSVSGGDGEMGMETRQAEVLIGDISPKGLAAC